MSAILASRTSPVPVPAPHPLRAVPTEAADPEAELRRWLLFLGTPFLLGATFFALSIGTSAHWLIGVALAVGPILLLFSTIYLCLTTDTNGEATPHSAGGIGT